MTQDQTKQHIYLSITHFKDPILKQSQKPPYDSKVVENAEQRKNDQDSYNCSVCDLPFSTRNFLNRHVSTTHFRCPKCLKSFGTMKEFHQHYQTAHPAVKPTNIVKSIR